jgi:TRAP-type C4-dicarboxylate transport system permease small subunit
VQPAGARAGTLLAGAIDGLAVLSGIVLALMALAVGVDVLLRNAFRLPITGVFDFIEAGQVLVVFAGLPKIFLEGANITVDLIDRVLGAAGIARLKAAAGLLAALFMALLLYAVFEPTASAWSSGERKPELGLPVYVLWIVMLLGIAASGFTALWYAWQAVMASRARSTR